MTTLLSVEDLTVSYGAVEALKSVSLEIQEGDVVAVLGANGAGKTTLLKAISGLVPDESWGNQTERGRPKPIPCVSIG